MPVKFRVIWSAMNLEHETRLMIDTISAAVSGVTVIAS